MDIQHTSCNDCSFQNYIHLTLPVRCSYDSAANDLFQAITEDNYESAKFILNACKGMPIAIAKDVYGYSPLHCAAMRGNNAIITLLIENGASVDEIDNYGITPLLYAAYRGHKSSVTLLFLVSIIFNSFDFYSSI